MSQTIPVVARRKKASSPIPSRHPTCVAPPVLSEVLEVAIENLLAECYSRLASREGTALRRIRNFAVLECENSEPPEDEILPC